MENESRVLTASQFHALADVPPETEWFNNIDNYNTRAAYQRDLHDFMEFLDINLPEESGIVTRAYVIAWRDKLMSAGLAPSTIRRKLSALSSLFDYLCENNTVTHNPVDGVKRTTAKSDQRLTPVIEDDKARALLNSPRKETLKGKRDRAILFTLLYHALRRDEVCNLKVKDMTYLEGVPYLRVTSKSGNTRFLRLLTRGRRLIGEYLDVSGHADDFNGPLFRPIRNNTTGILNKPLSGTALYQIVKNYGEEAGITPDMKGFCTHSLRATAATKALDKGVDIAQVQQWMGHANIFTTRFYDKRKYKR